MTADDPWLPEISIVTPSDGFLLPILILAAAFVTLLEMERLPVHSSSRVR